jgi:hypothetical protein
MARATLEKRVAELEKQLDGLLSQQPVGRRAKNWRRTRGAFTGDPIMQQVFAEGRKIRAAHIHSTQTATGKKQRARS